MKIHFVTEGSLNEYWDASPAADCALLFSGFNGLGDVDYASELSGETSKMEDAAILSREVGCVVVSGCYTNSCGVRRKSALVAERGRILGVSDMFSGIDESEYKSGGALKVYETAAGKIGLLIAEDLYFPEIPQMLSVGDADVLLSVFGEIDDFIPQLMARADAFVSGVPVVMCAAGRAQAAAVTGEVSMLSPKKECDFDLTTEREYHIFSQRRRGLCRRRRADF